MITPINNSLNTVNLSPVEIPHFKGGAKVRVHKTNGDSFKKTVKNKGNLKKTKNPSNSKLDGKDLLFAGKEGLKEGFLVIKKAGSVCAEFTTSLVSSLFKDSVGFVKERGAKTISTINSVI